MRNDGAKARVRVEQDGNSICVRSKYTDLSWDVAGASLPPLSDYSFAVWSLLPEAIRRDGRFDIEIDGPVSAETCRQAELLSLIWEAWKPDEFAAVRVTGDPPVPRAVGPRKVLHLFSGGMDSTHMLLSRGRQTERGTVLTKFKKEDDRADALLRQTDPLLERLNYDRIVLRTNFSVRRPNYHSYNMQIATWAFIFSDLFSEAHFAAERTWEQDFQVHPWGLNHATHRNFKTERFALRCQHEDLKRVEKVQVVASDPIALRGLSICRDKSVSPENCGVCYKCQIAKAMFVIATGVLPAIFHDTGFGADVLGALALDTAKKRSILFDASLIEMYQAARALGRLDAVPGLADAFATLVGSPRAQRSKRNARGRGLMGRVRSLLGRARETSAQPDKKSNKRASP
jgi:hypothetical protein